MLVQEDLNLVTVCDDANWDMFLDRLTCISVSSLFM